GRKLLGLVSSSCLIDPPKHRVIMIDHNEASQSVEGIEQAEVIEILDHHKLGAIHTNNPIYVYARPLGSSCTIVHKHYRSSGIVPPPDIAALLLSGILSDTIILRSPTTTKVDIKAAEELAEIAKLNIQEWGKDIFRHAASLTSAEPELAITSDFKIYTENEYRVGIAQMEVITLNDLKSVEKEYLEALNRTKQKYALDWALLMITDIIAEESILLSTQFLLADNLIYHKLDECTFHLPAVLSRKKQLLPEVLHVLGK
ncbi:MAG: DHH family phosphoesterase, partial [Candidatus Cloacimonetes bacterium]|nr:DHH family phosphoesterase [Candidatus Cloacimonadota bacterium]